MPCEIPQLTTTERNRNEETITYALVCVCASAQFHNVGLVATRVLELFVAFNELHGAIKHDLNELDALTYPSCQLLDPSTHLLGCAAACRESFRVFTFITCFMTQPAGQCTYWLKAEYESGLLTVQL